MNAPAVGPTHNLELARLVLNASSFDAADALAKHGGMDVQATREKLFVQLGPLHSLDAEGKKAAASELRKCLNIIGTACMPTMSGEQAKRWLDAVMVKLSDLPSRCACQAANEAVHQAFGYLSEAEQFIRKRGDELREQQRRAIARLDAMQRELHARKQLALPRPDSSEGVSDAEVERWSRTAMGRQIIRTGIAAGFIRPEQVPAEPPAEGGENG